MNKFKFKIKTECGLTKYNELKVKKNIFNKIRFYWFTFFAVIRDYNKS